MPFGLHCSLYFALDYKFTPAIRLSGCDMSDEQAAGQSHRDAVCTPVPDGNIMISGDFAHTLAEKRLCLTAL
jgi:hypothetical protein